jgi:hypothetical protein
MTSIPGPNTGVSHGDSFALTPTCSPPTVDPFWGSTSKVKSDGSGAQEGGMKRDGEDGGRKDGAKDRGKVPGSNFLFVSPGGGGWGMGIAGRGSWTPVKPTISFVDQAGGAAKKPFAGNENSAGSAGAGDGGNRQSHEHMNLLRFGLIEGGAGVGVQVPGSEFTHINQDPDQIKHAVAQRIEQHVSELKLRVHAGGGKGGRKPPPPTPVKCGREEGAGGERENVSTRSHSPPSPERGPRTSTKPNSPRNPARQPIVPINLWHRATFPGVPSAALTVASFNDHLRETGLTNEHPADASFDPWCVCVCVCACVCVCVCTYIHTYIHAYT